MKVFKDNELVGYSTQSIDEALQQAVNKIGENVRYKIIEMKSSIKKNEDTVYQAVIATCEE